MLSLSKHFETDKFIFTWDSKRSYRKDIYPTYKQNRHKTQTSEEVQADKMAFRQFHELRMKVLPKFGFKNNFIQTGLEADDLIAAITQNYNDEFIIISGDQDLYQLLTANVSMYSTKSKKLINAYSFTQEYGIMPKEWAMVKQIAGCTSDAVEGIRSVGEKTAVKFVKHALEEHLKAYTAIVNGTAIINRNEALVKLPFKGTIIPKIVRDEIFYVKNFIDIINKYGFQSFEYTDNFNQWVNQFNLK